MSGRAALSLGLLLPTLLLASPLAAADVTAGNPSPIITYAEVTSDAKTIALTPQDRVVDINSRLNLAINGAALAARLPQELGVQGIDAGTMERLKFLSDALAAREANLQNLKTAFSDALAKPTLSSSDLDQYYATVSANAGAAASLIRQSPPGSIFQLRRRQYFNTPPAGLDPAHNAVDQYAVIFLAAGDEAKQLQQDIQTAAAQNGVYVQLGAWVQDQPVHLEGFDAYPVGEKFVVTRFNITLTDAQKQELAAYTALSKKVNADGATVLALWHEAGPAILEAVASKSRTAQCIKGLQQQFETDRKELTGTVQSAVADYDKAKAGVDAYVKGLEALQKKYGTATGTTAGMSADQFLIGTNEDTLTLIADTRTLITSLTDTAKTLTDIAKALPGQARADITALAASATNCAKTAQTELEQWKTNILGQINSLRYGTDFDRSTLELGAEVTKLALSDVPETTYIPLTYTGKRSRGDALTVKLAAGTASGKRIVIEEDDFVLYQTLPFISLKVGLIFADPRGTTSVQHFQTAPAYSVLLKRDLRTHMFWNTLFDPGIGINVAALDFNHDDTPELGVGAVVSLFRDIVQVGYGYDVPLSKKYVFFGLRLPLPSFDIAGVKSDSAPK